MEPDDALRVGVSWHARNGAEVVFRYLAESDDIDAITDLLHRAYAPLAQAGMRYVASHQDADVTRSRMAKGDTVVAVSEDRVVGTVTLARAADTQGSPFYDRAEVACFGQFAVEPALQAAGVGSTLLTFVEGLAVARGVGELALDTSEHAERLIRFYTARGYRFVEHARWPEVNYRSVILAKSLRGTRRAG